MFRLTQHCMFFFNMKVHGILQVALGIDVLVRLKPHVCSMSSWAAGGRGWGTWVGDEPSSSLLCQVCHHPGGCEPTWITLTSHSAQGGLQYKEILYLIEQRNDLVEKCHEGLLCASHPGCAGSGWWVLEGGIYVVPLQLSLEERACPKPPWCLSFNPLIGIVLLL